MAQRRMFTMQIVDSDAFLDMPLSAQSLYFHLNMRADDDGFVNNPKKIQRMVGASDDDLRLLIAKRFVLVFENGVIVIKHWRMHNYIGKNRYHPTQYQQELSQLGIKENGAYTEAFNMLPANVSPDYDERRNNGETTENKCQTEVRLGKVSIGKDRLGKDKAPPTLEEIRAYCAERNSPVDPVQFFEYFQAGGWKDAKGQPVRSWKQKLLTWEKYDKDKPKKPGQITGSAKSNHKKSTIDDFMAFAGGAET